MLKKRLIGFFALIILLLSAGCSVMKPSANNAGFVRSFDGVPIAYETAGSGDTSIVLIHCWTCDKSFWSPHIEELSKQYRVVQIDLAGHGQSGRSRTQYSMEAYGKDVYAVASTLGLNKIVLVGHSMGGPASIEAEKLLKDRVIAIVGVETFYADHDMPSGEKRQKLLSRFESDYAGAVDSLMGGMFPQRSKAVGDWVIAHAKLADARAATSSLQHIFSWYDSEAPRALQRVDAKLWAINADWTGNKKNHEREFIMEGVGHFPAQEKPAEFRNALVATLDAITKRTKIVAK